MSEAYAGSEAAWTRERQGTVMASQALVIGEQSSERRMSSASVRSEATRAGWSELTANAPAQEAAQEAAFTARGSDADQRPNYPRHTECFSCARIFFDRFLEQCPRCGSRSVQQYTTGELNLLSRPGDVRMNRAPGSWKVPVHATG